MASDRVAALTDAAIELIAESGMRGLTHRAVDARAGVPPGSTSVYFRTRAALITGVVERLAELDRADVARDGLPTGDMPATQSPPEHRTGGDTAAGRDTAAGAAPPAAPSTAADLDQVADAVAALLDRWLTSGRTRMLARYVCLLEATHRPQLREVLSHGTRIRSDARELVARTGAPDPQWRANQLVAYLDGLLFDRLVGAGALTAPPAGTAAGRADLARAVRAALRAVVEQPG